MTSINPLSPKTIPRDLVAGLVVFLVALPLCLGVALASNAPLFSGILAGIVGGLFVGFLSGSHTSVSGPAAGLTAVVAAQIASLGTFEAFLAAVVMAGVLQIVLGLCKAGFIAAFFPSSVIKGLLAAIGVILILKQIPHVVGHDADPMGNKSFQQADNENTFSELAEAIFDIQPGAALVGMLSLLLLVGWDRIKLLKKSPIPAPLVVVIFGVVVSLLLRKIGGDWAIETSHLVQVPVSNSPQEFLGFLRFPDFSVLNNPAVYVAAFTIAIVASLETLLNLEAVDKLDPEQRSSPPNRELLAQGVGNVAVGLIGGLPMTSVIVRSSVNINAGVKTKLSTIFHGALLLGCVMLVPGMLNEIPLSALAAILLVTGLKLASPKLLKQMWSEGRTQFLPFIITVVAIVLTDLLVGILIGLAVAVGFILHSNLRRPIRKVMEKHATGDVLRIELANQVSFFNRASLEQTLRSVPRGGHVLIDARNTDYIDPDILDLITDFRNTTASVHGVEMSLMGFKDKYPQLEDRIQYVDFSSRDVQNALTPQRVLEIFQDGNERFRNGTRLTRDLGRQVDATAAGQFPMAVVLSCIDSRTPTELVFDLGLGDIFSVRIAGNIARDKVLGSMEYSCAVAGAKLVLVMGHTSCGAVNAAVDLICSNKTAAEATGCVNLDTLITEIQKSVDMSTCKKPDQWLDGEKKAYANEVSRRNVLRTMRKIRERSSTLDGLVREGKIAIVGGMYDVSTGQVTFFQTPESSQSPLPIAMVTMV
ncbi:carbonic anhydrase/SulP family sulfate permease [Prosthecobacter fusiformis]|uniref:Carbonic anhydrase/SulP family sulfate permease n=1 Tax=Prosthecobacter fusiformis TaxID=48464 RepID=A0A4R7S121_9BACT|nr:SulP family inorganic anion transporter [Prosthecobacter fusiformis]TDU70875.1 carbonic anhydrase/SulP family sulfate permease [Prosthecobacter fusiformis]